MNTMSDPTTRGTCGRDARAAIPTFRILAVLSFTAILLLAGKAHAHEEGVLTVGSSRVAAGSSLRISGEKFSRGASYELALKGGLREYRLGVAKADEGGRFGLDLTVPADVLPGAYRLVAVAADGDDAAGVDMEIGPAVPDAASASTADLAEHEPVARADEMALERRWSDIEWFIAGLLLGVAAVGGVVLYRRPRAA